MRKRITSRLAKRKQKELAKQTIVLAFLAIAIIALFVFAILPAAIKIFFGILGADSSNLEQDLISPQQPIINAPPIATNSATLSVKGYTEPQTIVHLVVNNQKQDKKEAGDQGEFEFKVKLTKNSNKIGLYSQDKAENESEVSEYLVTFDSQAPEIKLASPEDEAEFYKVEDRVIEIKGETEANATVYVNNRLTYANEKGLFELRYPLNEGENKLEIKAIDLAGNEQKTEITVKYRN
ncbi:MAG: hypothetical protein U9O78_01245 [Patescibacteria group bacterium]|nr:hypothetical protein [Patescibacteria group bacterium]